jgi:hypothetical protein
VTSIEFVPAGSQPTDAHRRQRALQYAWMIGVVIVACAAVTLLSLAPGIDVDAPDLLSVWQVKVWPRIEARGQAWLWYAWAAALPVGLIVTTWYARELYPRGRLLLDATGVHHRPAPLPGVLGRFDPPWSVAWSAMRRVEALPQGAHAHGPCELRSLVLVDAGGARRRLRPFAWERRGEPIAPRLSGGFLTMTRRGATEDARFAAHPLVTALAERGFAPAAPDPAGLHWSQRPLAVAGTQFDLGSNPTAVGALVVGLVLAAYGIGELVVDRWRFASPEPVALFAACAALGAAAAGVVLRRAKVPWTESLVIALLLGGACWFAARPAALRANAATDADGAELVYYAVAPGLVLEPPDASWPRIEPAGFGFEYWSAFRAGDRYPLAMRRGALGFWEYDAGLVHEEVSAFARYDARHRREAVAHARRILAAAGADR